MNKKWEYATLEWLWDSGSLSCHQPNVSEQKTTGSYAEVVQKLTELGQQGWEVVTCVANANWLFWTLKREI